MTNNNIEEVFQRKLEKKIKDKDLASHLISFYDKQIEEIVVSLFLYHLDNEVCLSDDYLTRYSFLLKNEHYLEANHRNRLIKTREISGFELFDLYFEKHFEKIKTGMEDCAGFKEITKDKNEILEHFKTTKSLNEKRERFLKLRKNPFVSNFMDLATFMFLVLCVGLLYQLGINGITISIAAFFGLTFTFIQSSGEYFEKNRFKYKVNKILPKTFMRSVNAVSSLYMSIYLAITIGLLVFTSFMIANQSYMIFGFKDTLLSEIITFLLASISGYWQFRKAVYNQRYFMYKNLEKKKEKDDIYLFLKKI